MGNKSSNTEYLLPVEGLKKQFLQSPKVFLRKKKILLTDSGTSAFHILDILKGDKEVELQVRINEVPSNRFIPLDSETLTDECCSRTCLRLINLEGKVIAFKPNGNDYFSDSRLLPIGNWIYSQWGPLSRIRKDLSGGFEVSKEVPEGLVNFHDHISMGSKIVSLYFYFVQASFLTGNNYVTRYRVIVWDTQSLEGKEGGGMKIVDKFDFIPDVKEEYSFLRKLDDDKFVIVTSRCGVVLVNTTTRDVSYFEHRTGFTPSAVSVHPGFKSKIFVTTEKEVKVLKLYKPKTEKGPRGQVWERKVTEMDSISDILAIDVDQVFVMNTRGNCEIWRVGRTDECLLRVSLDSEVFGPELLPLTREDEREENERFTGELASHVLCVPREVLGIVAGFI